MRNISLEDDENSEKKIFLKLPFREASGRENNIFLSGGDQKEQCLLRIRKRELLFFSDTGRVSGITTTGYISLFYKFIMANPGRVSYEW